MAWNREAATAYVRALIERELGPEPKHGAVTAYARRVDVTSQTISQLTSHARRVGPDTFEKFAKAYGKSHDAFMAEAAAYVAAHPEALPKPTQGPAASRPVMHTYGSLPGWSEAEAQARRMWPRKDDEFWARAARFAGSDDPRVVTPYVVFQTASFLEAIAGGEIGEEAVPEPPAERDARRAEIAAIRKGRARK